MDAQDKPRTADCSRYVLIGDFATCIHHICSEYEEMPHQGPLFFAGPGLHLYGRYVYGLPLVTDLVLTPLVAGAKYRLALVVKHSQALEEEPLMGGNTKLGAKGPPKGNCSVVIVLPPPPATLALIPSNRS